jgi:hypothetical protein
LSSIGSPNKKKKIRNFRLLKSHFKKKKNDQKKTLYFRPSSGSNVVRSKLLGSFCRRYRQLPSIVEDRAISHAFRNATLNTAFFAKSCFLPITFAHRSLSIPAQNLKLVFGCSIDSSSRNFLKKFSLLKKCPYFFFFENDFWVT